MTTNLWITKPPVRPQDGHGQHNHRLKIDRLVAAGRIAVTRGSANQLDVVHDDWCAIFDGGFCNCDPDIRLNGKVVSEKDSNGTHPPAGRTRTK